MTAALDLSALVATVEDDAAPLVRKGGAGRPKTENLFLPIVWDSWEKRAEGSEKGITKKLSVVNEKERGKTGVPKNITTILGLIRRAADEQGLGVQIVTEETNDAGKPTKDDKPGTMTVIRFASKVKTERTRKDDVADEDQSDPIDEPQN